MSPTDDVAVTLIALLAGLWVRRATWGYRWDKAPTINLATLAFALFCMSPATTPIFDAVHISTGLWNIEDLAGHLVYLGGITVLAHSNISRLDVPDMRGTLRARIKIPALVAAPVLIVTFMIGHPRRRTPDLIGSESWGWLRAYCVALVLYAGWILANLLWALLIVRTDPRSSKVATLYIAAVLIDMCSLVSLTLSAYVPAWPDSVTWSLVCSASIGYAVAATYGMHKLRRRFASRATTSPVSVSSAPVPCTPAAAASPQPSRLRPRHRRRRPPWDLSLARHRPPL